MMNILSPHLDNGTFEHFVRRQKDDGANFVYLYTMNEKDGGWTPYSPYVGNNIGQQLDDNIVEMYEERMKHIRGEGMGIIIWLRADDSPHFNRASTGDSVDPKLSIMSDVPNLGNGGIRFNATATPRQEQYQRDMVDLFDKYASAYFVGLELDEYYGSGDVNHYANQLQGLTDKPILSHQKPGKDDFGTLPTIDAIGYQYGFGKSEAYVESQTAKVIVRMGGKPVYAVEYHKSSDDPTAKALGDAAMRGGAAGTGNNRNNPPDVGTIDEIMGFLSTLF